VPAEWGGVANPLVGLGHARPNPSDAYLRTLGPDAEAVLAEAFGRETRKKLRKKERMLAERGTLSFGQALTPEAVDETLEVFLTQKGERMRALGIDDPFAEASTRAFLRRACHAGLARGEPAIELYALRLDERIIATFGGTGDRERLCGMFNSFDLAPDLERCSPGEVLLSRLVRLQCERGRVLFDLGVGEARYKEALCDRVVPLRDVIVPVTVRGRAYAAGSGLVVKAKRAIKRHPVAWRLATALRAALRRGR
jgi:CelD/BcsL family acetyltransferase involved in cellulose biosynthesis